jgi:hypothetical protein
MGGCEAREPASRIPRFADLIRSYSNALARRDNCPTQQPPSLTNDLDHQFGDVPVGLRKIAIHRFAGNPRGQLHLHYLEARPGMRSSRRPLVACSDVIGSSITDILVWKRPAHVLEGFVERLFLAPTPLSPSS